MTSQSALRLALQTDRDSYAPGAEVHAQLSLTNGSDSAVTLRFTSGQRYDFHWVDASGAAVWTWSRGMGFIQALGQIDLASGESVRFEERFAAPARAGSYTLRAVVVAMGTTPSATRTVSVR